MGEAKDTKKEERLQQLYALAMSSKDTPPPKRAFLSWKCPKCGSKLHKESLKELIVGVEGENTFVNTVIKEASLTPGAYYLHIEHFTCPSKDYEFAKRTVEEVSEGA
jgi:hypothetical protein